MTVTETAPDAIDEHAVDPAAQPDQVTESELVVEDDVLVEEISIDGMCGVY